MRAHVILPEELVNEVDQVAGTRKRSAFFEAAIREKLARERQSEALRGLAGILAPEDYPEWATPEQTSAWVRAQRRLDDESLARKLARPEG
ncbi:MAG: hypothetical protein HYY05_09045 [Chloroflexi bacterium]|nr:hypothetical protein [Chloroflexota bacterium]